MPKKGLTVEEVKKAKIQMEKDVLKTVADFEKDNGVYVSYISLKRKRDDDEAVVGVKEIDRGPIINVDASMELDLVY